MTWFAVTLADRGANDNACALVIWFAVTLTAMDTDAMAAALTA